METDTMGFSCEKEHYGQDKSRGRNRIYYTNHCVPRPAHRMTSEEYKLLEAGGMFKIPEKYPVAFGKLVEAGKAAGEQVTKNGSGEDPTRPERPGGHREFNSDVITASYKISSMRQNLIGNGLNSQVYMGTLIATKTFQNEAGTDAAVLPKPFFRYLNPIGSAIKVFRRAKHSIDAFEREFRAVSSFRDSDANLVNFICAAFTYNNPTSERYTPLSIFYSPEDPKFTESLEILKHPSQNRSISQTMRPMMFYEFTGTMNLWEWICENSEIMHRDLWKKWALQLSTAVKYLHSIGIIHQDIKPHNVIVGNDMNLKLADFGDSCFFEPEKLGGCELKSGSHHPASPALDQRSKLPLIVEENLGKGTFAYKAPELITKDPMISFSPAVDVYALGITLWIMLSGKTPFAGAASEVQMVAGISRGFFACGMQAPSRATPEFPFSDPGRWNLCFPSGDPVGSDIQLVIASALRPTPSDRSTAAELYQDILEIARSTT